MLTSVGAPGASTLDTRLGRLSFALAGTALISAVLWPTARLLQQEPNDDFPFSHYPMFSARRGKDIWVSHLLGHRADGTTAFVHYSHLGVGGLNQIRRQVRRLRRSMGEELALKAAASIASRPREGEEGIVRVEVVHAKYHLDRFFEGDRTPLSIRSHGAADIPGRTTA